ncbi:tetratricopeptide (TPR) repeat protein [Flavobacterium arsenatis]|uniref:Tetratricopeptide (TPR) repeat protein n=1 Tax=Flavobacterium arsenatis TaxID=1484332 RepID=A0ABU1TKU3_9FLAO|nr:tetratricopeptide repeat protein [Flavobacterium arsenatis]MDR6966023.1 tetratricopeptide (TPR) repeat protein [Flavobacterium arsenatis]
MQKLSIITFLSLSFFSFSQTQEAELEKRKRHDELQQKFVTDCAEHYNYNYNMNEWQACLDAGLKVDSTYAYFWQQKAMPYFKARKYEVGMNYIDKAVLYDAERWQPYRAFIKCIFAKTYKDAILDFEDCIKKFGNGYVMDHTYNFYIAISCLQLNEFSKVEILLQDYVNQMLAKNGEDWLHPTALFYLGISQYEQSRFEEAITNFDKALKNYKNLAEAQYYKAICLAKLGKTEEYQTLLKEAFENAKIGYKLSEDNTIYETYPYQPRW